MSQNTNAESLIEKTYDKDGFYGIIGCAILDPTPSTEQKKAITRFVLDKAQQVLNATPNKEHENTKNLEERIATTKHTLETSTINDASKFYHKYIAPLINGIAGAIRTIDGNDKATLKKIDKIIPSKQETENAVDTIYLNHRTTTQHQSGKTSAQDIAGKPKKQNPITSAINSTLEFLGKTGGR